MYGKGNYFARDAVYSSAFVSGRRNKMLVARVLVGDVTLGDQSMVKPPAKDSADPHGETYDSCVDLLSDPSIYVTFEFGQSYPAYVIEY